MKKKISFNFDVFSGSHVIEHERQRMVELKKKSQDEARAQYLQTCIE